MNGKVDKGLSNSVWYNELGEELRAAVRSAARVQTLRDGQAVYRQGDAANGLYGVVEGQVRLTSYSEAGAGHLLLLARPGDWFGEISTLDEKPRQQDAVSQGQSVLLHLGEADVDRLAGEDPSFWRAIGRLACLHQRAALGYLRALVSMPAEGRVIALLVVLNDREGGGPLNVTHEEIAASVGLSRQTVNAILGRLQRRDLIELGYRGILVRQSLQFSIGNLSD